MQRARRWRFCFSSCVGGAGSLIWIVRLSYVGMKPKWSLLGVVVGAVMCAAGILRYNAVMRAWEHTTFHPDFESDPPLFFAGVGLVIMAVAVVGGIVGWLRRRSAGRSPVA